MPRLWWVSGLPLWTCLLALLTACAGTPGATQAGDAEDGRFPTAPMREEVLSLPGDPLYQLRLQATLYLPPGPGPFPLAVMNHGATNATRTNRGERYRFTTSAYYFLSRGYAVLLPMARGFAGSEGNFVSAGCDLAKVARRNGADIAAATEALARRPEIDGNRIVVAGQSFGGWNTLGLGSQAPAGVRALIAFNPAIRSSDCHDQDRAMADGAADLGASTNLPSLWFFGDNDSVMPVATWRAMFDRYKATGTRAELVDIGTFGNDSHQMLSSPAALALWTPRADAFLARAGLPSAVVYPEFLPRPAPPPSHFAALTDVDAVPGLSEQGKALYRKFLTQPLPRAFVLSPGRGGSAESGGYDPLGFGLRACGRRAPDCRPYAVDNEVVWTGGAAVPPSPREVSKTVPQNAPTVLGAFYAVKPDCSSRGLPTVAVTDAPRHGTVQVATRAQRPSFPAASPFAACNTVQVPATGVTYTPAPGYAGQDAVTLDETDVDGRHRVIRLSLTVQ